MKQGPSNTQPATPLSLGQKLLTSENFMELFRDGMELVEDTASYLDGTGKDHAKKLGPAASLAYATETMRLTTRLMQMASWLLLQRAVTEGEIDQAEAQNDTNKLRPEKRGVDIPMDVLQELPEDLQELIDASLNLQRRVKHVDAMLKMELLREKAANSSNPVGDQLSHLSNAFRQ